MVGMPYPNPTDPELQERMRFMDSQQQQHALRPALVTEHDIADESCLQSDHEMTQVMSQDLADTSRTDIHSTSAQNQAAVTAAPTQTGVSKASAQKQAAFSSSLTQSSASAQRRVAVSGSLRETDASSVSAQVQAAVGGTLTTTAAASSVSAGKQVTTSGNLTAGREYYEDLCMKAVNQCVGRVIRHKGDYAAIVLADARWCSGNAGVEPDSGQTPVGPLRKLPTWIQGSLTVCRSFGDAYGRMHRFHRQTLAPSMAE